MNYKIGDYFIMRNKMFWTRESVGKIVSMTDYSYKIEWIQKGKRHLELASRGNKAAIEKEHSYSIGFLDINSEKFTWYWEK